MRGNEAKQQNQPQPSSQAANQPPKQNQTLSASNEKNRKKKWNETTKAPRKPNVCVCVRVHRNMGKADSLVVGVELLVLLCMVNKDLRRLKLRAEGIPVPQHRVHKLVGTHGVDQAEGATTEGWEANAKHSANVCTRPRGQDGGGGGRKRLV